MVAGPVCSAIEKDRMSFSEEGAALLTVTVQSCDVMPSSAVTLYTCGKLKSATIPLPGSLVAPIDNSKEGTSAVKSVAKGTSNEMECCIASMDAGPVCSANEKEVISVLVDGSLVTEKSSTNSFPAGKAPSLSALNPRLR